MMSIEIGRGKTGLPRLDIDAVCLCLGEGLEGDWDDLFR